ARGRCPADGTRLAVYGLRTVRGTLAGEAVALHGTGEALALGGAGDVDERAVLEHVGADLLADLEPGGLLGVVESDLGEVTTGGDPGLIELAGHRLGDLAGVDRAERDLD